MKIDKITLCNLTAFADEQVIDFTAEPLRSAGLFAICGDTGAGKSTLLDAVCLALYDNAPRLDRAEKLSADLLQREDSVVRGLQADNSRNLMRRGAKEAYVRVEFSLAGGAKYEAGWSCRLKRTGNYDQVQRTFRQTSPKKQVFSGSRDEIQQEITRVIGLDYTQFSRTVMLAQNSFATFLKARKDEKSALLEKLTGTEIYGKISMAVHRLHSEALTREKEIESRIEGILQNHLDEATLADVENSIHHKEQLKEAAAQELALVEWQKAWADSHTRAQASVAEAERHNMEAQRALAEMRHEQLGLERYDEVLEILPLFQNLEVRRKDLDDLKTLDEQAVADLSESRKALRQAEMALTNAREQAAAAETELQRRQPALNHGHQLEGEIAEADQQLAKASQQLQEAADTLTEKTSRRKEKQATLDTAERQAQTLSLHRQALAVHRVMFDKMELIKDRLATFKAESEQNAHDRRELDEKQAFRNDAAEALEKLEQKQNDDLAQLNALKSELLTHRQANQGKNGEQLQQNAAGQQSRLQQLEHARELWKRLVGVYENADEKQAKISRDANALEQLRKELLMKEGEVRTRREDLDHKNESYMLSNSENIRRLRKSLKEGTACPVCGATHHPYHTETERELGELIDGLEKDFFEAKAAVQKSEEERNTLASRISAKEAALQADREMVALLERQRADYENEWQQFAGLDPSFKDCSPTTNRSARGAMMSLLTDSASKLAEEAAHELAAFNLHQQHINGLSEKIEALSNQMQADRTHLDTLRTNLKINQSQADTLQQRLAKSERVCGELYRDLSSMITLSGWFADWRNNADGFRNRLSEIFDDWNITNRRLEETQKAVTLLREEVRTATDNESEATRKLSAAREERDSITQRLAEKREELRRLFGEASAEQEEARLREHIRQTQLVLSEKQQQHSRTNDEHLRLEGQHTHLMETRRQKQEEYSQRMSELDVWILRFNASHSPVQLSELRELFSGKKDWNIVRANLDLRKQKLTLAAHELSQARAELASLEAEPERPSGKDNETAEALTARADTLRLRQQEMADALLLLRTRLQAHTDSLKKASREQHQLELAKQDTTEWSRLDTLIGSADGKKFRELAQSCTFSLLVNHANTQLRQFSPRYQLHNLPGTLALEVIDREMFDERRYVSSLSGGETFVVSLALALGLAGLSSAGLSIGSLFIDEGFGNLDHESLNLVLQALANLDSSQGRKVGIVSHTEQIREHISPQIRVEKLAGGKSRIVIA